MYCKTAVLVLAALGMVAPTPAPTHIRKSGPITLPLTQRSVAWGSPPVSCWHLTGRAAEYVLDFKQTSRADTLRLENWNRDTSYNTVVDIGQVPEPPWPPY